MGPKAQRWLRFVVGGGINTGFTYLAYLGLNTLLPYQVAYLIAYAVGIVFSYGFNARVVFHVPLSWRGLFSYPIVYVVQYGLSALLLGGLVEHLHIAESLAPLVITIALIPLTFVLSKLVLERRSRKPSHDASP